MSALWTAVLVLVVVFLVFILRLYTVVKSGGRYKPGAKGAVSVLAVAGSGGHTSELLRLLDSLSGVYTPRYYLVADTDHMSEDKITAYESNKHTDQQFSVYRIPRSREVHQSWCSSVVSTLNAVCYSIPLVFRLRPDMVLCNGPGTCVPVCAAGILLGVLGIKKVLIVYVESICRVHSLSLTGTLLYPLSDYFFVQWAALRDRHPKAIFLGRIV